MQQLPFVDVLRAALRMYFQRGWRKRPAAPRTFLQDLPGARTLLKSVLLNPGTRCYVASRHRVR